jgi:hypothetical protein
MRTLSSSCNLDSPKIGYLGSGREFTPPAMEYPWVAALVHTNLRKFGSPQVTWLWRYEAGPIDWQPVMDTADQQDFVITAPHYIGEPRIREDEDNRYNVEFVGRLAQDPHFLPPIKLQMGRFQPVELDVFPRRGLTCNPPLATTTAPQP